MLNACQKSANCINEFVAYTTYLIHELGDIVDWSVYGRKCQSCVLYCLVQRRLPTLSVDEEPQVVMRCVLLQILHLDLLLLVLLLVLTVGL